jgi:hypothetical protein
LTLLLHSFGTGRFRYLSIMTFTKTMIT